MISSVVERFVHIEDVRGSNPLSPTMSPFIDALWLPDVPCGHFLSCFLSGMIFSLFRDLLARQALWSRRLQPHRSLLHGKRPWRMHGASGAVAQAGSPLAPGGAGAILLPGVGLRDGAAARLNFHC